ncbi:MAG: hypothetical protein HXS54_18180 [Theionarchaea archaeon]|nr:hypothetical protein [Theionarchaea archaeon]
MHDLLLEKGEQKIISSHAQFQELIFFSQYKTGEALLTDRRFVFLGRFQVRSLGHLAAVAPGKGMRDFEISTSQLKEVMKKGIQGSIEVIYEEASKEKKVLLKPEKTGEIVGSEIGGRIGEEGGELAGKKAEEFHGKSLVDAWIKAFEYVIRQKETSPVAPGRDITSTESAFYHKSLEPEKVITPRKREKPIIRERSGVKTLSTEQILSEELGRDFLDFKVSAHQEDYLVRLIRKFEKTSDYAEKVKYSEELRGYLRKIRGG